MNREKGFDPSFAAEVTSSDREPEKETLRKTAAAVERMLPVAAKYATEESTRHNELEITDSGDMIFLCPADDLEDGSGYALEFYKNDSPERVMEDVLGVYTYHAPDKEQQYVHVTVRPGGLSRRFEDTSGKEKMRQALAASAAEVLEVIDDATSHEDVADRIAEAAPDFVEAANQNDAKRAEAEAFEELTGMGRVTEESAQKLLEALEEIEKQLGK